MDLANDDLDLKESGKPILANSFIYGLSRILWNEEACNGCYGLQNKTSKSSYTKWDFPRTAKLNRNMRKIVI